MAFVFKLQSVLHQRQVVEDQRQRELARLLRQRMILHQQLGRMQQTIRASKGELSGALLGRVDMERVAGFARYSGQVTAWAQGVAMRLAKLEQHIREAQKRLLEATQARRALELLRDRQWEAWQRQQDRRDVAAADEATVQRYGRALAEMSA